MRFEQWAQGTFGHATLGDVRRTRRLVQMAAGAARNPAGLVTEVYRRAPERQAAYDFLESEAIGAEQVSAALFDSTMRAVARCQQPVFVVVDGSSLTLTELRARKGFGHIGPIAYGARGLKVISALAVRADGVPLGLVGQVWWTRQQRAKRRGYRPAGARESVHWRQCVANVVERCAALAPTTRLHFIFDREGDAALLLRQLAESDHDFTIRAHGVRKVMRGVRRVDMRRQLRREPVLAETQVQIAANSQRKARTATVELRAAHLPINVRDNKTHTRRVLGMTVVWAKEPQRACGLSWILYQSTPVTTAAAVCRAVQQYTLRWRIEEFHRAWKAGRCRIEETQLRSVPAVIKWATLLGAVATRAEQLRVRARTEPDASASTEFSEDELLALVTLRQAQRPKDRNISAKGVSLGTAIRWVADLGGYVGAKSSGLPGTVTIGRGLDELAVAALVISRLREAGKMR